MAQIYTESLLNDGSALDGYYLYGVTLNVKALLMVVRKTILGLTLTV